MDVVKMYDHYFMDEPYRTFDDRCTYSLCENSIVYRRLRAAVEERDRRRDEPMDILEYMLYNVSGDTGLPAHYSCCLYLYKVIDGVEECGGHVCNAIPIMIGSRLELRVVTRLCEMLDTEMSLMYDTDYLHEVYRGSFLVNGTFYYSVFRESNNNKICHNSRSKYRGDETVAYFYDKTCNRGVKLFTNRFGELKMNDRDGHEVADVTSDVMMQLYKECVPNWRHYTLDMRLVTGFFSAVKKQGLLGIDNFKNKIYTNYSTGLNTFLDKLPLCAMRNPMWNSSLMTGKINSGISQRLNYPKSKAEAKKQNEQKLKMCTGEMSTGYLVETQRRRNIRKRGGGGGSAGSEQHVGESPRLKKARIRDHLSPTRDCKAATVTNPTCDVRSSPRTQRATILGSKDVKTVGLMVKLEQSEQNGPSTFNQVSTSYLPLIRVLSHTVQKLQVEHVHAESSKTVPRDAYGFICMKYMGNIATAGKNMLFTERVQVSYGHAHRIVAALERGIERLAKSSSGSDCPIVHLDYSVCSEDRMRMVINNAVTHWSVSKKRVLEFLVFIKSQCHRFAWTKQIGDDYFCIYYYEGVPLLHCERAEKMFDVLRNAIGESGSYLDGVDRLYLSRDELETLADVYFPDTNGQVSLVDRTNTLIDQWFVRTVGESRRSSATATDQQSLLAKQLDQYTGYTPPAKRSVSVNARKSACTNVYYQPAADLIRGFHIFVDPEGYEKASAERVATDHGPPAWVTLRDFIRIRGETDNCPQPQDGTDKSLTNFYMLRTVFADVAGYNVEDANVLDTSVDLKLAYSYSFSLSFVDRTERGLDIVVPHPRNAAAVCCWDSGGNPTTVLFMVCMIRKKSDDACSETEVHEMLRLSTGTRMVYNGDSKQRCNHRPAADSDSVNFPPFRKLSVIRSADGNYHVYFMRNDAVLLRSIRALRQKSGGADLTLPNKSNATRIAEDSYAFLCKPEVNPYDALTCLRTKLTSFEVGARERVVTVDVRVHGTSDKYDGVKIVNSFGQKGLALIRDVRPYFRPTDSHNLPVQLVMNNCSFVSRQPIGQYLQMRKNMTAVTTSAANEATTVGYTAVFITETEPVTKSCLVRFDEMMRSVIVTLGLAIFQNLKNSLDNVYNPYGVLYPPQTRQILGLYRCVGASFSFSGDTVTPFASRQEVNSLIELYEMYDRTPRPGKAAGFKAVLDLIDVLNDKTRLRRLRDIGVLKSRRQKNVFELHLRGQWNKELAGANQLVSKSYNQRIPDYELCTYSSRGHRTVFVFGEPSLLADALDDRSDNIMETKE